MVSETKAASDTYLHQHESISSLVPRHFISSINAEKLRKYQSGNNISSREINHKSNSLENSVKSINDNYQRFSNNNLLNTHFPIANLQQDSLMISKTSSSQLPTVPKQAGTFIHRLVNKLFSISNTKNNLSRTKRKQRNSTLSNDSHTILNITPKKRRRQRLKTSRNNHPNKYCDVCRRHRNCFTVLPTDSLEYPSQSPMIFNANAATTAKIHSVLVPELSIPKIQFEKLGTLNASQCQTIASAVELIFDTLISNYQPTNIPNMQSF